MGCLTLDEDHDHFRLVYITFFTLGMTTLFAFNSFVSAPDFMINYFKYCGHRDAVSTMPDVWNNVMSYISVANMIPNLVFQVFVLTDFGRRVTIQKRIICSMFVVIAAMAIVPLLTYGSVSEAGAIAALMTAVSICGAATAILQASAFALAASFPPIMTGAMLFGIGASGTISCIARIITKASMTESFEHTLYETRIYFGFAIGMVCLSMLAIIILKHNPYALRYVSEYREADDSVDVLSKLIYSPATRGKLTDMRSPMVLQEGTKLDDIPEPSVRAVLYSCRGMLFSCFFIFFVTLTLFPGVGVAVNPNDAWFGVIIIAMFNFGDTVGRLMSNFPKLWIPRRWLPLVAVLRVVFVPLFIISINPKVIKGNGVPYFLMFMVGTTNGLPGSVSMIYGPMTEELQTEKERQVAGNSMSLSLLSGCSAGSLLALLLTSKNWL